MLCYKIWFDESEEKLYCTESECKIKNGKVYVENLVISLANMDKFLCPPKGFICTLFKEKVQEHVNTVRYEYIDFYSAYITKYRKFVETLNTAQTQYSSVKD